MTAEAVLGAVFGAGFFCGIAAVLVGCAVVALWKSR